MLTLAISRRAAFSRASRKWRKEPTHFVTSFQAGTGLARSFNLPEGGCVWGDSSTVRDAGTLERFVEAMEVLRPWERVATRAEEANEGKQPRL